MSALADLFLQLESNNSKEAEEVKHKLHEQFNFVQDSWLLYGVYDYYVATNSVRAMEILVNIREPHHEHLFKRMDDALKGSKHELKVLALNLLGHILRKQPPWLYKITEHQVLKNLFKLLKNETDIFLLINSLLILVVLLPIVPSRMGQHLTEIFDIFRIAGRIAIFVYAFPVSLTVLSRLAAWNCNNPEKVVEEQLIHLQVALYALFQRLYGMYPCNFLAYLRNQYRSKEHMPIFAHTVKPMLDTVKMHPLLVTASKDKETTTERWKKMEAHDVVVECERFSLGIAERCQHESCYLSFRSRSGTTSSTIMAESSHPLQSLKSTSVASLAYDAKDFFSPSMPMYVQITQESSGPTAVPHSYAQGMGQLVESIGLSSQEGTSPPEAAIEATPETTPVKDIRHSSKSQLPSAAAAVRTLTNLTTRNWSIGSSGSTPSHSQPSSPMRKEPSPFNFPGENRASAFGIPRRDTYATQKIQRMIQDRTQALDEELTINSVKITTSTVPTSPLRTIPSTEARILHSFGGIESPVTREDEEVLTITEHGQTEDHNDKRQCDSVLQEGEGGRGTEDDLVDDCAQEHGSPCAAGGLHMPNSRSMNDFAKRVRRLRYHSQCAAESELPETSTGSSPGNYAPFSSNTVRRANSCPEMKKSPVVPTKDNRNKTLLEADEENKENLQGDNNQMQKSLTTVETQTEFFWQLPYEHLFLGIFPSLESGDVKPSPAPSPAPLNVQQDKFQTVFPNEILDKYIDLAVQTTERDSGNNVRVHLNLLHHQLFFERYRRETHAARNRRLLADAKSTKSLEEHNSALKDQLLLQQKDIDNLKEQLESIKKEKHCIGRQESENIQLWESKYISLQKEYKILRGQSEVMQRDLDSIKKRMADLDSRWQQTQAALLEAEAEVKIVREQAWAGEKGKAELERVSKQLLVTSELQQRYREKLAELPSLPKYEQELALNTEAFNSELKTLRQALETKTIELETRRARIVDLEQTIVQNEESIQKFKRTLNDIKEECELKLKAMEGKYLTQVQISRFMDERILELWHRIEVATGRPLHSPDTSSCQEVQVTMTDKTSIATGLSPHSSPLSASLASSEGSIAFCHSDVKNLQSILDQKDPTASRTSEDMEVSESSGAVNVPQPSTSKQD